MQTEPRKNKARIYAPAGVVLIILSLGAYYVVRSPSFNSPPSSQPTTSQVNQGAFTLSFDLRDRTLTLSQFSYQITGWYLGSSFFGAFTGCLHINANNDTLYLPQNSEGFSTLYIGSGTMDVCPVSNGLSFDFQGNAVAGSFQVTRLSLTYATVTTATSTAHTTTVTRTVNSTTTQTVNGTRTTST